MKNRFFLKIKSKIKLNIKGKNIERFIKRLISNGIELLKINYLKYNEVNIIIYKDDYDKVMNLKTIYEVTTVDIYGIIKVRKMLDLNKFLISFSILGIAILIFLSNIIFSIEVIHTNSGMRNLLLTELESYGIKNLSFKKSYDDIQKIKSDLLTKYNDKIEWLEIENSGTKYIVRIQDRIIIDNNDDAEIRNIIATKDALLKKVVAKKGEVIKNINDYVSKGSVVISGNIYLYEQVKETIRAEGEIYGEVWYQLTVDYPFIYNEIRETGNTRNTIVLKLFNKEIELNSKYQEKITMNNILLAHSFLPFSLIKQNQKETITISEVLTEEQAITKALDKAITTLENDLADDEYIIDYKIMKTNLKDDRVVLEVFFSVYENITGYEKIIIEEGIEE